MKHITFAVRKFAEYASRNNIEFNIEPATGFCGRFEIGDRNHYVIGADLGLNRSSSQRISNDKLFTNYFLNDAHINTIDTHACHSISDIRNMSIDYPAIIKPNEGFGGVGVHKVDSFDELRVVYKKLKKNHKILLLQQYIEKPEFRIFVYNNKYYFSYQRIKFSIIGNGILSIKEHIALRNERYRKTQHIKHNDKRMLHNLEKYNIDENHIPDKGQVIELFSSANLKDGASLVDTTNECNDFYKDVAIRASKAIGLTVAGIDIFANSLTDIDNSYKIIEVNSNPGFEYFTHNSSILDDLFADVVRHLKNEL